MNTRQADRLIKSNQTAKFQTKLGDTFSGKVVKRDRYSLCIVYTLDGKNERTGIFSRDDTEVVTE